MTNPEFLHQAVADIEAAALDLNRRMESPIRQLQASIVTIERLEARLDEREGECLRLERRLEVREEEFAEALRQRDDEIMSLRQRLLQWELPSRQVQG